MLAIALVVGSFAFPVDAAFAAADTQITIQGGGWGHAIGMPQYAARGMADDGATHEEILGYFYTGTETTDISSTNGSGVPDHILIGTPTVVGETRPFKWLDFSAVGGTVEVCLEGEAAGGCSFAAAPGETWRVSWNTSPAGCTISRNSVIVSGPGACNVHLEWSGQPDVRVSVPEVGRVFARGSILFSGPVTYNASTGFHFLVSLTMDEYLYGLAEMPPSWPAEALEAQAVAARTFAAETTRRRIAVYGANGGVRYDCSCHLVWSTSDQSYKGWSTLTEGDPTHGANWRAAVDATSGEVVVPTGTGSLAETYYSSSTGGATENVWDVWGSDPVKYSYLASVPDPWSERFTAETSTIRWTKVTTAGAIASALGLDTVDAMEITARYESGSPSEIVVNGTLGGSPATRTYTGGQLKSALGLTSHHIYSIQGFGAAERIAGSDRYATAAAISSAAYPDGSATVYVAVGTNHPDAIAAGPAAAAEDAPILLTKADSLPGTTRTELQRLSPTRVVILGGTSAVSDSVSAAIAAALPGATVERRSGPTRYETAASISAAVFPAGVETVYVATGQDFPDALIAAPAAISDGAPLLLISPNGMSAAVRDELTRLAPERIVIVGGTAAVSSAAQADLAGYAATVDRVAAGDRYSLSAEMARIAFPTATTVYVVVGDQFPDALSAAPLTGHEPGPLLLVQTNSLPPAVVTELGRVLRERIVILGGPMAVSSSVATQLATYL